MNIEQFINELSEIKDRKEQVEFSVSYILKTKKKTSSTETLSTKDIIAEFKKLRQDNPSIIEIPDNTITVYISQLANSKDSKINCPGKKQGYYLDLLLEQIEAKTTDEEEDKNQHEEELKDAREKGYVIEKDLYPFFEKWLFEVENERVADISNVRGQGKWANPDLLGLKIDYFFQTPQIEITTIEAKVLMDDWEKWIFEAIAHTVFSNRSYFAFVHSEDHINKLPHELRHYAEKFGIGILVLAVEPEDYIKIQKKEPFELSDDNHRIVEYVPAPYQNPHLKFQKRFLEGLNVHDQKDLLNYGKSLEK